MTRQHVSARKVCIYSMVLNSVLRCLDSMIVDSGMRPMPWSFGLFPKVSIRLSSFIIYLLFILFIFYTLFLYICYFYMLLTFFYI
jgi:hypothetical protein